MWTEFLIGLVVVLVGAAIAAIIHIVARKQHRQALESSCLKMLEGGTKIKPSDVYAPVFERLAARGVISKDGEYYSRKLSILDVARSRR